MPIMQRSAVAGLLLSLAACAVEQTIPSRPPGLECALTSFPPDVHIDAWSVDKFAGRYLNGTDAVTVRRDDHRLFVEGSDLGSRQLTTDNVESWTWRDGCGVRYDFALPPDGPGAWLKIVLPDGRSTDWHR
jgi:hypothetical protein